jgi:hypothetical protein
MLCGVLPGVFHPHDTMVIKRDKTPRAQQIHDRFANDAIVLK